jgi:hypothetical protein
VKPGSNHQENLGTPERKRSRRGFLQAGGLAAGFAAVRSGADAAESSAMPIIRIGRYSFSKLICGSNCFNAGSHLSVFVNHEMRAYYTPEQILKTLRRCQEVGINTWQGGMNRLELYRRLVDEGGKMHYITIEADPKNIDPLKNGGCVGIAHHGETTDKLYKTGGLDKMRDFLKRVRDAGLLVGVSTHMAAVVDVIESKGWDVDYYMTCVYERHRSQTDLTKLLGQAPIPPGEVYLPLDPPRMFKVIRQTNRPCLAFKILAAGRLSDRPEWVERAFRETLTGIKPTDGIIIGIYDRYSDQPAQGAELVRRHSPTL